MRGLRWTVLAILPALGALAGALAWPELHPAGAVEVLGAHLGESRWSEGRSALPLPWRPWRGRTRLGAYERLLGALYQPAVREDPQQPLALAHQYVWRGGDGDADRAAAILEAQPESAVVWNERALVLLASERPVQALAALDRSLALDPRLPAALFNRALVLETLVLHGEARAAWHHFLSVEPAGPWADEATLHWERLGQRSTEESSEAAALRAGGMLCCVLPDRAALEAWLQRPEVRSTLAAEYDAGDRLLQRQIAWLRAADEAGWALHRRLGVAYTAQRALVLEGRMDREVVERLGRTDAPIHAVRFAILAAYDELQREDVAGSREALGVLEERCRMHGCGIELTLARSDLGTALFAAGDYRGAERAIERSLAELPRDAHARRAEVLGKLGLLHAAQGARTKAQALYLQSAGLALRGGSTVSASAALLNLSQLLSGQGMPSVVAAFAREARRLALEEGPARIAHKAATNVAAALREEGRLEEAAAQLEAGWDEAQEAAIAPLLAANRRDLAEVRLDQGRADEALALLEEAAALLGSAPNPEDRVELARVHARALEAVGDERGAARHLEEALALSTRAVAAASSPLVEQRLAASAAPLAGRLALARARLDGVEAGWKVLAPGGRRPLEGDECLVAPVPLQGAEVALFFATRSDAFFEVIPALARPELLSSSRCGPGTRRIVLLDGVATEAAPWARALRQAHPRVAVVLAGDARTPWPVQGAAGPALVVHSPSSPAGARGLAFLYGAEREAAAIARALPASRELRDEAATPAAVRARARGHGLLHFAVHGEAPSGRGAASHLLLAGEEGLLQVVDVLALPLADAPVVVLSACRSGGRSADRENDGAGLAWAFLRAGARAVIAHQDDLRDDVGLTFAEAFYAGVAAGRGLSEGFETAVGAVRERHGAAAAEGFLLSI